MNEWITNHENISFLLLFMNIHEMISYIIQELHLQLAFQSLDHMVIHFHEF